MKRLLPVLLVLAAAACNAGTEPESQITLNFNAVPVDTLMAGDTVVFTRGQIGLDEIDRLVTLHPVIASTAPGTIRVTGAFVTGSACGTGPTATVERQPDGVVLRVSGAVELKPNQICFLVPQPYTYEARLTEVPTGNYRVTVRHVEDYIRSDTLVLEQQVQVP